MFFVRNNILTETPLRGAEGREGGKFGENAFTYLVILKWDINSRSWDNGLVIATE